MKEIENNWDFEHELRSKLVNQIDNFKRTPLHVALYSDNEKAVRFFLDTLNVCVWDSENWYPLECA